MAHSLLFSPQNEGLSGQTSRRAATADAGQNSRLHSGRRECKVIMTVIVQGMKGDCLEGRGCE